MKQARSIFTKKKKKLNAEIAGQSKKRRQGFAAQKKREPRNFTFKVHDVRDCW